MTRKEGKKGFLFIVKGAQQRGKNMETIEQKMLFRVEEFFQNFEFNKPILNFIARKMVS